eukprot:73571_1
MAIFSIGNSDHNYTNHVVANIGEHVTDYFYHVVKCEILNSAADCGEEGAEDRFNWFITFSVCDLIIGIMKSECKFKGNTTHFGSKFSDMFRGSFESV